MTTMMPIASLAGDIQEFIFDAAQLLLYPILDALLIFLLWALVELGVFVYEVVQRYQKRDLDALEASALRARKAFAAGKPRAAYRHLQENIYSIVVTRFLFDLIQNYQTERLAAKPLKLLQEYEFYTIRRLERTRILTRIGPILGLMGGLIPLAPALSALARGDVVELTDNLRMTFSVVVIGLLIGAIGYIIGTIRDRMYSQDISDLEYMLELLEGNDERLAAGRRRDKRGQWEAQPRVAFVEVAEDESAEEAAAAPAPPTGWRARLRRHKEETAASAEAGPAAAAEAPTEETSPAAETPAPVVTAAAVELAILADTQPPQSEPAAAAPAAEPEEAVTQATPPAGEEPAAPPQAMAVPPSPTLNATDGADLSQTAVMPTSFASFDAPERSWFTDDDPFAALGPADNSDDANVPRRHGISPMSNGEGPETA